MNTRVAITVLREREELARLWTNPEYNTAASREIGAAVVFKDAPGDRGTEIHVDLSHAATAAAGSATGSPRPSAERRSRTRCAASSNSSRPGRSRAPTAPRKASAPSARSSSAPRSRSPIRLAELEKVGVS